MAFQPNFVSIVIPTYNQAEFLIAALEGIMAQTYPHWEAIIVNNFSTDTTEAVVKRFVDPRIRLINFSNQGVIAASRNLAIKEAKGEFVAFLDSDDTWYPKKLEICLAEMAKGYDVVCHGQDHFNQNTSQSFPVHYGPVERTIYGRMLAGGNCLSTSALIVRSSVLSACGNFSTDPSFNTAEDFDLWLKLSRAGARIKIVDEMLGMCRIHGANTSKSKSKNARATLAVMRTHLPHLVRSGALVDWVKVRIKMLRIAFFAMRTDWQIA